MLSSRRKRPPVLQDALSAAVLNQWNAAGAGQLEAARWASSQGATDCESALVDARKRKHIAMIDLLQAVKSGKPN